MPAPKKRPARLTLLWVSVFLLSMLPFRAALPALAHSSASKVEQWGIEEITLRSDHTYVNPFTDVQLTARFTCADRSQEVAGFFDGEQTWKVRFMPEIQGHCIYSTASNDPQLNNLTGDFSVGAPSHGNHGPVHVSKAYHFSYADGTPYFLLGTTLYNWLNRDEVLQRQTLDTLSKNPFTKVRFGLFPKWYAFNHVNPESYPYVESGAHELDFERFNPKFFNAVESQLRALENLGIEADIILFHPYDRWGFAAMDAEHDDAYIRYVAARFSAFRNVWWTMANEYDLFDPKMAMGSGSKLNVKDWDRMFRTLEASDPYRHLRGIHNFGTWYDHSKPWITHAIIQDGTGHPGRRVADARLRYKKPVVVDEYGYEGNNGMPWGDLPGPEEVSRHWDITMQGAYASHGETYVHPNGILWWAAGGRLVGDSPARLGFLRQIMTEAPFQDLTPAPDLVQGGALLALKGVYYLLRVKTLDRGQHVEIQLEEKQRYHVDLVDPWLMKVYKLGVTSGGLQAFDPRMAPCLLRFTRADDLKSGDAAVPVQALFAKFLNDSGIQTAPEATPIRSVPEVYNEQFTLGELLDDPRTRTLLTRYVPELPNQPFLRIFPLEQLQKMHGPWEKDADYSGLIRELNKITVQNQNAPGSR